MHIEVLGITLTIFKSSTYLALRFYCLARLLARTEKSRGASLVPCLPLVQYGLDNVGQDNAVIIDLW